MKKKIRLNCVEPTRRYKVRELADKLNITRRTVYYMIKDGLPVLLMNRTYYIVGTEFIEFEKARRKQRKKGSLKPDEFYCVHCNLKRKPKDKKVEVKQLVEKFGSKVTKTSVLLRGICPVCGLRISRLTNISQEQEYKSVFNIVENL